MRGVGLGNVNNKMHTFFKDLCYVCVIQFGSTNEAYQYVWLVPILLLPYFFWGIDFCKNQCQFHDCGG